MTELRDLRLRIQEVSISVAAAILTSAFATYTTIQVTLAETRDKVEDHDRRMILLEKASAGNSVDISSLLARQSGSERTQAETLDRIKTLDTKIDTLLTRSRRNE